MPNPLKLLKLKNDSFQLIQEVKVNATPATVWKSLLNVNAWWHLGMLGPGSRFTLEPRAGGRFFERGKGGVEALHGLVTYVLPGKLIRFWGPMGSSHLPISSVFIFEISPAEKGGGTMLRLCHRCAGMMTPGMGKNYGSGWPGLLKNLKALAEKGSRKSTK